MTATRPDGEPLSLWHDQGPPPVRRRPLGAAEEADVAIVGGGYTGLWTAYYLLGIRPQLRVVVLEAEFCGFGASGRNGGWVSPKFPGSRQKIASQHGPDAVRAYQQAMLDSIDEIGKVVAGEGIECEYARGGMLLYATRPAHVPRLRAYMESLGEWGFPDDELEWLDADEAVGRGAVAGAQGALYTPRCASVHPWRLVAGLAQAVERRGATIYEASPVRFMERGLVLTDYGVVRAPVVLRCTEAFTPRLPGHSRSVAPVYSLMVATEPLDESWWRSVGLANGEAFSDGRHMIIYGRRTRDGRLAFGGRGAPYHLGSTIDPSWEIDPRTHGKIEGVLWELFPQLGGARITHRWGGAVAVPRDWRTSVDYDPAGGLGHAGGYVGQGVTGSHLAGRTLAELVSGVPTERGRLPFVGHRWRRWEPEPLRWLGINLGRALAPMADTVEEQTGRPARFLGGMLDTLTGG
ncbi:MAG: NAD(P)/FAD-dependent oxidoreductase [Actinomycetota bacterium]